MLRQIPVYPGEQQHISLSKTTKKVEIVSRGGDLIVSVGDGDQDVEFDGKILPFSHSATVSVVGDSPSVAVMLVGDQGVGMLQVSESGFAD